MLDKSTAEIYFKWKASFTSMASVIKNGVKELRVARKWTQEQLAEAVGVSRQSINAIERNRHIPSLELALIFARVFSCPVEYIFRLESKQ
jgi:putative transcriptional regulator